MKWISKSQIMLLGICMLLGCSEGPVGSNETSDNDETRDRDEILVPGGGIATVTGTLNIELEGSIAFVSSYDRSTVLGRYRDQYHWRFIFSDGPHDDHRLEEATFRLILSSNYSYFFDDDSDAVLTPLPEPGTYIIHNSEHFLELGDDIDFYGTFSYRSSDGRYSYATNYSDAGGTLTIHESSEDLITGSFEFTAHAGFLGTQIVGDSIIVEGEFLANVEMEGFQ